jgi:hypothetical protein
MAKNPEILYPDMAIPDSPNGFNYSKSHIAGNLYGIECILGKDSYLNNAQIDGEIHFEGMSSNSNTLYMKKAKVQKEVFFNSLEVFKVRMDDSEFSADIEINGFRGKILNARRIKGKNIIGNDVGSLYTDFNYSKIQNLLLNDSTLMFDFRLLYAEIYNTLSLNGSRMHTLQMNNARIGNINFNSTIIHTLLDLSDATIKGCLGFEDFYVRKYRVTNNTVIPMDFSKYLKKNSQLLK